VHRKYRFVSTLSLRADARNAREDWKKIYAHFLSFFFLPSPPPLLARGQTRLRTRVRHLRNPTRD